MKTFQSIFQHLVNSIRRSCFLLVLAALVCGPWQGRAQSPSDTLVVPFGDFEEWEDFPGDTLLLGGFLNLPVYDSFSVPQGWSPCTYDINENANYMGIPLSINTSIPMVKVVKDTLHAPQGHAALGIRSYVFSDLVSPLAYTLAESMLDSTLSTSVIPSIVANGHINTANFLPLLEQIDSNTSGMSWLLPMMDTADLNDYVTGGFPLNGFEPKMLKGYYIYRDGCDDLLPDNGTVVAIGTYYDTISHRRLLVGAGSKNLFQLYDTTSYEAFYMEYFTLNNYYPSQYAYVQADTMLILLISSANEKNRTRGSTLYVDNLTLLHIDGSCGRVYDVVLDRIGVNYAQLRWNNTVVPDKWRVEYGPAGFTRGRGTEQVVTDSVIYINGLSDNTSYDAYIRSECGDTSTSSWAFITFTTDTIPTHSVPMVQVDPITVQPNPAAGQCHVDFGGVAVNGLRLYAANGRLLDERVSSSATAPLHPTDGINLALPGKGIYILQLQTEQGTLYKKIVSQ